MSIKNIFIGKKVKYNDEHDLYTLQMIHRRFPWWILLLLLIPLLFIRCNRNLTVECTDEGRPVANEVVQLKYTSYYFLSKKIPHEETELTDSTGEAHFRLKCSVYSYIFHFLAKGHAEVDTKCLSAYETFNYHLTRKVHMDLLASTKPLLVKLVDLETKDPLAGGTVIIRYRNGDGDLITDSAKTDPAGVAMFEDMRTCMTIDTIFGSCYGYHDSLRVAVGADELHNPDIDQPLPLRPLKESFTFFVKSETTHQPIPGAQCTVTLISPNGHRSSVVVYTSIDGRGVAVCPPVRTLDTLKIHAEHPHYYPGDLKNDPDNNRPWQVKKFKQQPDSIRVVWLKPKPYTEEFQDVDSLTGAPIAGVTNDITLTSHNGQTRTDQQISNSNGYFTVNAEEDDQVEVYATKNPTYEPTTKQFGVYRDITDKRVPMMPKMERIIDDDDELPEPTENCGVHFSGLVLSDEASNVGISVIFGNDPNGEYVGHGFYPNNSKAFPKAVGSTFDAIAVDKGTRLVIYSEPNFNGTILLDVVGPMLITNVLWVNDFRYNHVATKTFTPSLQALFPVSRRQWSSSNMHNWSYGSCKITCAQCGE